MRENSQHWYGLGLGGVKDAGSMSYGGLEGVHHRGTVTMRAAERESHLGITITCVT